jgi:cation diffusion facilitator CzcD-associated flavoprotein CzcO
VEHFDVAIVGAGFGGLGAAIRLKQQGFDDVVVLERGSDVGGTWHANSYPGSQCDIPSNLYSFSFALNPDWTRSYPEQPQIQEYLRATAERFGVMHRVRLNTELTSASWDADAGRWLIETSEGSLSARVLVAATGMLSEPYTPPLPGLETFAGPAFHSARWDPDVDLSGKRVGLVGTGASAIQIGPRIEPRVGKLTVFQRTPPWILPHFDREISPLLKRAYRALPALQRIARASIWTLHETFVPGFVVHPAFMAGHEWLVRRQLRRQVADPDLRARLTPDYAVGCKRLLLSESWYPMLQRPGVELVEGGVTEVRERSVIASDGREHELDVLILATGFTPADPPIAKRVRGAGGATLAETWDGSPQAYLGTTVAGFPNLFLVWGPNLNLGHSSVVYMIESQHLYLVGAMNAMRSRGVDAIEVRPEAQRAWNEEVQRKLAGSVWNTGCSSWYIDRNGRNSIMWPGFTFGYRNRARRFDPAAYRATGSRARALSPA